jgi:hypothetical protein
VKTLAPECDAYVRKDAIVSLSEEGDGVTLAFGPTREVFSTRFLAALRHIASSGQFRPCDLPGGLSRDEQLALTRRVVESGLCTLGEDGQA